MTCGLRLTPHGTLLEFTDEAEAVAYAEARGLIVAWTRYVVVAVGRTFVTRAPVLHMSRPSCRRTLPATPAAFDRARRTLEWEVRP